MTEIAFDPQTVLSLRLLEYCRDVADCDHYPKHLVELRMCHAMRRACMRFFDFHTNFPKLPDDVSLTAHRDMPVDEIIAIYDDGRMFRWKFAYPTIEAL